MPFDFTTTCRAITARGDRHRAMVSALALGAAVALPARAEAQSDGAGQVYAYCNFFQRPTDVISIATPVVSLDLAEAKLLQKYQSRAEDNDPWPEKRRALFRQFGTFDAIVQVLDQKRQNAWSDFSYDCYFDDDREATIGKWKSNLHSAALFDAAPFPSRTVYDRVPDGWDPPMEIVPVHVTDARAVVAPPAARDAATEPEPSEAAAARRAEAERRERERAEQAARDEASRDQAQRDANAAVLAKGAEQDAAYKAELARVTAAQDKFKADQAEYERKKAEADAAKADYERKMEAYRAQVAAADGKAAPAQDDAAKPDPMRRVSYEGPGDTLPSYGAWVKEGSVGPVDFYYAFAVRDDSIDVKWNCVNNSAVRQTCSVGGPDKPKRYLCFVNGNQVGESSYVGESMDVAVGQRTLFEADSACMGKHANRLTAVADLDIWKQ